MTNFARAMTMCGHTSAMVQLRSVSRQDVQDAGSLSVVNILESSGGCGVKHGFTVHVRADTSASVQRYPSPV